MERFRQGLCVVMIDDAPEDILLVRKAFEHSEVGLGFHGLAGVREGIAYLAGEGEFADRRKHPFPNVVLCDIKMPGMDGFDFLKWLRHHPECRVIPTIMFSSSYLESDVQRAYTLGCNAFVAKPPGFRDLVKLMRRIQDFWSACEVPVPPPTGKCS